MTEALYQGRCIICNNPAQHQLRGRQGRYCRSCYRHVEYSYLQGYRAGRRYKGVAAE